MFTRLVKQFNARGARDHLRGARRLQEEADLHRLYVLTSFYRREGDGSALVDAVMEEGKHLGFDELKAEVSSNLTDQIHRSCAAVRDAVVAAAAAPPARRSTGLADATGSTHGFACRVAPSGAGPNSGDGLFVRGAVDPGEIVALYPGVVYGLDALRHMPGYPEVALRNPYLMARYDGSVIDANPWGRGGPVVHPSPSPSHTKGHGRWPGPPIAESPESPETSESSSPSPSSSPSWLEDAIRPELDAATLAACAEAASAVERDHPLALAHFANHPPRGIDPNVVVASVDVAFDAEADDLDASPSQASESSKSTSLRRFLPNVGVGEWAAPETREEASRRTRAREGGFIGRLQDAFGTRDDGPPPSDPSRENGARARRIVVPALALVAAEALRDEEVFLNYRLSTHVNRPVWYHPVNAEEDARRWAME